MSVYDDIQVLALHSVVREDPDYQLRRVFRWYSKTLATPLHVVEGLPTEEVLRHYFEARFEDLEEDELKAEIERLTRTPEETERLRRAEDAEDAEMAELTKLMPAVQQVGSAAPTHPLQEKLEALQKAVSDVQPLVEALPDRIPEGISMEFEAEEDALGPSGNLPRTP